MPNNNFKKYNFSGKTLDIQSDCWMDYKQKKISTQLWAEMKDGTCFCTCQCKFKYFTSYIIWPPSHVDH